MHLINIDRITCLINSLENMNLKKLLLLLCLFNFIHINAQDETALKTIGNEYIFENTLIMPRFKSVECEKHENKLELFKCSQEAMRKFIYSNLKYPNGACIEGTVVISFVVAVDGSIQKPQIIRDIGVGTGEEALRIVKLMPKWEPGQELGRIVPLHVNLPIKFCVMN